jgi:hypothetical protein
MKEQKKSHHVSEVLSAIVACLLVVFVFDSAGLFSWTRSLKVSEFNNSLRDRFRNHWANMESANLSTPKHKFETYWSEFREAHKLLYPRTFSRYEEVRQNRKKRQRRKEVEKRQLARKKKRAKKALPKVYIGKKKKSKKKFSRTLAAKTLKKIPKRSKLIKGGKTNIKTVRSKGPNVLLMGDSMMVSLAPTLKKGILGLGGTTSVDARVSTGLARPDVYNWPQAVHRKAKKEKYDYIVVVLGTNDGQDFAKNGRVLPYGSRDWVAEYRTRLKKMMATSCRAASQKVLWLGLPPMRKTSFNRKIHRINSWIKRQSTKFDCVEYVDLNDVYGDQKGRYLAYKDINAQLEKIRTSDGIHITRIGGKLLTKEIIPIIKKRYSH